MAGQTIEGAKLTPKETATLLVNQWGDGFGVSDDIAGESLVDLIERIDAALAAVRAEQGVEAALAELRELFPKKSLHAVFGLSGVHICQGVQAYAVAPTLAEAMAKVRAGTRHLLPPSSPLIVLLLIIGDTYHDIRKRSRPPSLAIINRPRLATD